MHACLHDELRVGARRLAREAEAVADEVADAMEDLRRHIVVGEDDRVLLPLQPVDLRDQRRMQLPFEGCDAPFHLLPDGPGFGVDLSRKGERLASVGHGVLLLLSLSISYAERNAGKGPAFPPYAKTEHKWRGSYSSVGRPRK